METSIPEAFKQQMKQHLGAAFPDFLQSLAAPTPISIRPNRLKQFRWPVELPSIPWYPAGSYLEERPSFTLDPYFHAGAYYVQEASSMFVGEAIQQILPSDVPVKALDLCAAPGGKSTLLLDILPQNSFLLSNEVIRSRFQTLQYNLVKWGTTNSARSNHDSVDFKGLQHFFDLLLIDAPCSGEGLFRKDHNARKEWSPQNILHCAARQRRILGEAIPLLKPGGIIVYCTCTYNQEENEANANWIGNTFGLSPISLDIPENWKITPAGLGYQFFPHLTKGEGFYLACFQKEGSYHAKSTKKKNNSYKSGRLAELSKKEKAILAPWLADPTSFHFFKTPKGNIRAFPKVHLNDFETLASQLPRLEVGFEVGQIKHTQLIPSSALALNMAIAKDLPMISLDRTQALQFLRKDMVERSSIPKSWALMRYNGFNLGWIKGVGKRYNNYYPSNWRIRMEI